MADVVLARPHDLHGRARVAGDKGGLNGIILNKATAKATTDECDVDFDALARNPERTGNGIGGGSRDLRGRPEFAGIAANVGRAIYGLHRGVGEERHFVNGINFLHGTCMCLVEVAVAANDGSRLGSEAQHFFTQAGGAFGGGRRLIPFDLEKFSRLHGGPGRIGDNSHASAGVIAAAGPGGLSELMRQMGGLHFEHRADMGSRVHFVSVEMARRAAVNRAAYHGGNEHSGKPSVQAEFGGASYFGERICAAGRLADKLEVRRILQRRIIWR